MKVYVKLEGHEFRYEIENILKMFFEMGSTEISYQDPERITGDFAVFTP